MRLFVTTLVTLIALTGAGFLALVALVWYGQERIVFQPPGLPQPVPEADRRIHYTAADGQPLFAYLLGEASATKGILIAFHGNADLAVWQIPWAREIVHRTGRAVLLPEYRGYAGLPGRPTYEGAASDARAAYSLVRDSLGIPGSRIALFGHSLGSAIAADLARDTGPQVLVLQSPFTSARDMVGRISIRPLALVWKWIARVHYDTEEIVRTLSVPLWVAHGQRDAVVPVEMGEHLFATARHRGEILIVRGAGHNDVAAEGSAEYWRWLGRALTGASPQH